MILTFYAFLYFVGCLCCCLQGFDFHELYLIMEYMLLEY